MVLGSFAWKANDASRNFNEHGFALWSHYILAAQNVAPDFGPTIYGAITCFPLGGFVMRCEMLDSSKKINNDKEKYLNLNYQLTKYVLF